jgi:hypothetical protein
LERVKGIEPSLSAWESWADGVSDERRMYAYAPDGPELQGLKGEPRFQSVSSVHPIFQSYSPQ